MTNGEFSKIAGVFASAAAAMLAPMAATAAAPAQATFGSAAILTSRNCTATTDGDCQVGSRNFLQYAGGAGSAFSVSATNEANSGAAGSAYASFDANGVPTLGVASSAGAATRTGTSALAYRTYVYNGASAIDLALAGTLHYIGSGDMTPFGGGNVEPGGRGFFGANLTVLPLSALADIGTSGQDLIISMTGMNECGAGATANAYGSSNGLGAGEHSVALSLTTSCNGGAITILPGQSFVIMSTVQAISNMSGYVDAMHTFSAYFDPERTVFTATGGKVGATFLAESIAATPEPATWAEMILGFAAIGFAARRARRARREAAVAA